MVDEQFKQDVAAFKDITQTRFDAMNRNATQHNTKVHEALSAVARCLQELAHLTEPAVEGGQSAAVQVDQTKINPNDESGNVQEGPDVSQASGDAASRNPKDLHHPTSQCIVQSNGALQVFEHHYFSWLKSLDFRPPLGMVQFKNASLMFYEIQLFKCRNARYYMVTNGSQLPPILKKSRQERGHRDDDSNLIDTSDEKAYLHHVLEMEPKLDSWMIPLPRYVVPLGHLFVNDFGASVPVSWTGYHVVMDITTPSKTLWLVYCHEGDLSRTSYEHVDWPHKLRDILSPDHGDVVKLAPSLGALFDEFPIAVSAHLRNTMAKNVAKVKPVFTAPNVGSLLKTIQNRWPEYRG